MRGEGFDPHFIDLLAHELRAPLFPIIALSDYLLKTPDADVDLAEWRAHVQVIESSGQQLLQLIADFVDISRVDIGKIRPTPGPVVLQHFAEQVVSQARERAGVLRLEAQVEASAERYYTERHGLERIGGCLIAHALDDAKQAVLHVVGGEDRVELYVEGPRVATEDRSGLFEPFWRRAQEGRPRSKGNGLALVLVRRLAELVGGEAFIRDEGEESRVGAWVPAALEAESPAESRRIVIASACRERAFKTAIECLALGHDVELAYRAEELGDAELVLADAEFEGAPEGALRATLPLGRAEIRAATQRNPG